MLDIYSFYVTLRFTLLFSRVKNTKSRYNYVINLLLHQPTLLLFK